MERFGATLLLAFLGAVFFGTLSLGLMAFLDRISGRNPPDADGSKTNEQFGASSVGATGVGRLALVTSAITCLVVMFVVYQGAVQADQLSQTLKQHELTLEYQRDRLLLLSSQIFGGGAASHTSSSANPPTAPPPAGVTIDYSGKALSHGDRSDIEVPGVSTMKYRF